MGVCGLDSCNPASFGAGIAVAQSNDMSLLTAEVENLSKIEEEFFMEGFRLETEGLAQVEELDEVEPAPGLFRRLFGRASR